MQKLKRKLNKKMLLALLSLILLILPSALAYKDVNVILLINPQGVVSKDYNVIGDIFSGFQFIVKNLGFLFDGFPSLLLWLSDSYLTDAGGMFAFGVIANTLRAVYALLICSFLIEFLSGRYYTE